MLFFAVMLKRIFRLESMSMTMIDVDGDRSNDPLFVSRLSFNELIIRFPFFYSFFSTLGIARQHRVLR